MKKHSHSFLVFLLLPMSMVCADAARRPLKGSKKVDIPAVQALSAPVMVDASKAAPVSAQILSKDARVVTSEISASKPIDSPVTVASPAVKTVSTPGQASAPSAQHRNSIKPSETLAAPAPAPQDEPAVRETKQPGEVPEVVLFGTKPVVSSP